MYHQELIMEIEMYVTKLFDKLKSSYLVYHNLAHTQTVVERVNEISKNYSLEKEAPFILNTAAWFHDTGQLFGPAQGHEKKSNIIMSGFVEKLGIDQKLIGEIEACILATRFPYQPTSLTSEILCDADSYHLGTDDFLITDDLVKEEYRLRDQYIPDNWNEMTLSMMETHHFFTPYCKILLQNGKDKNIQLLRNKLAVQNKTSK